MIKFWCEEMKKKHATHIINIQNHFPICKYENKHLTQEVYPCMNALCYHLGAEREGIQGLHPSTQGRWPFIWSCQIANHLILRQWPTPRAATVVILALSEPKPNISSLCPLPPTQAFIFCSLDSYYPWVIRHWKRIADNWEALYFLPLCCSHVFFF